MKRYPFRIFLGLAAAASGASTTRYVLSHDTVKSQDDVLLTGGRSVSPLAPGATSSGVVSVTIPSSTALGVYHLIACADGTNAVPETNETNNCLASTGTMNLTAPAFDPAIPLKSSGRVATVAVLATCTDGAEIHLTVSVEQADAYGQGKATGKCTGSPGRYPVTVSAEGSTPFAPGAAVVHGEALVKLQGEVLDDHFWTRTLNLAF